MRLGLGGIGKGLCPSPSPSWIKARELGPQEEIWKNVGEVEKNKE